MPMTQEELKNNEEKLKELVYGEFDRRREKANNDVRAQKGTVNRGSYEDQMSFSVHSKLGEAERKRHEIERLISMLYDRPYFAHISVDQLEEACEDDYFLSDCENLDEMVSIGNNGFLIPFKQDEKRPISDALFRCYQARDGKKIFYKVGEGTVSFLPKLICDTDVESRVLRNVIQYYPTPGVSRVTADEMLESKLDENRNDPTLRNIISTLQLRQFEIIGSNLENSFVVQGCAGSGKSQCLIHRLFFFRAVLAKDGWDKVLLITPTKLFRQYSAGLMKRYQLTDLNDCSVADLYRNLLSAYDERFRDRQYVFQLTEEYLPDGYLHDVYEEENIQKIEREIEKAILQYVQMGCRALGMDVPERITTDIINEIVGKLDIEIEAFDKREKFLSQNKDYQAKRDDYERVLKDLEASKRKLERYKEELSRNIKNQQELKKAIQDLESIELEKKDWLEKREKQLKEAIGELETASRRVDRGTDLQAPAKYAKKLYVVKDLTEGEGFESEKEELAYYDELISLANNEIKEITRDKRPQNAVDRYAKREKELRKSIDDLNSDMESISTKIEEYAEWLRTAAREYEGHEAMQTLLRSDMQQARYFLSRIESTIFEREVWNSLAPKKEQYGIQTLLVEELKDGKRKESRILYKSDLLFYVRIYMRLRPDADLPAYSMICVDEGQDLHRADYEVLRSLFPKAVLNVFGDVDQVLHTESGIEDWKKQTGISTIYALNTNYRNTAAIVDFCNKRFGVKMDYVGNVNKSRKPEVVTDKAKVREILMNRQAVLIVKDKAAFQELCDEAGMRTMDFTYLDTNSDKTEAESRECYSVFAAKGLEFPNVFVFGRHMTKNQNMVACTRAMGGLFYYE